MGTEHLRIFKELGKEKLNKELDFSLCVSLYITLLF